MTKPLLLLLQIALPLVAAEIPVSDLAAFDAAMKKAMAGDVIVLQNGEWKNVDLRVRGKEITVRAQEAGKVIVTGNSRLRFGGETLVVEGLWFRNCFPENTDIVTFREDSKKLASHSVLRGCAITQDIESTDSKERKWVSLYGWSNAVEHCHFEGKTSKGTLLVVWLPEEATNEPFGAHMIEYNYFGPRPRLGKNGGEIIRIGDSDSSMQRANCAVAANIFEKCDGEVECISNKACDNDYGSNVFIECQGTLTLRHGDRCLVVGNVFLGNGRKETGGIRIIGENHIIKENYLSGLEGDEARSAICLQNAIENSPLNGYFQVKGALIQDNTILDCKHSITIGYADKDVKATLPPVDSTFQGNYVSSPERRLIELMDPTAKIAWKDNIMWGSETGIGSVPGISLNETRLKRALPKVPSREEVGVSWLRAPAK